MALPKGFDRLALTYAGGIPARKGNGHVKWVMEHLMNERKVIWATDAFGNKTEIRPDLSFKFTQVVTQVAMGSHELRTELLKHNYKELT